MRILYADSDLQFCARIRQFFAAQGWQSDVANDYENCLTFAEFDIYDVIIVDYSVCENSPYSLPMHLRENKNITPMLYIGAQRDIDDLVNALEKGADDYMSKPFAFRELSARVKALSRRKKSAYEFNTLTYKNITLDLNTNELICNGKSIRLGVKEFLILKILINQGSMITTKDVIEEKVWGINSSAEYNNVEVYISFIRKKLKKLNADVTIKTLRNSGYFLG